MDHLSCVPDVAPPIGDLWRREAKRPWSDKVILDGVDPTIIVSRDQVLVREMVGSLVDRIRPSGRLMLGSADATPHGVRVETFRLIRQLIKCHRPLRWLISALPVA